MSTAKRAKKPSTTRRTLPRAMRPRAAVTRDRFLVWRTPRAGVRNPHPMTNPVWSWLAQHRDLSAWSANAHFDGPSSMEVGPAWCGMRFGQSETALADGRVISIGGEHEDHYDPDFYIYNDVWVTRAGEAPEIYGYPYEVFPPTDFHSATLVGERIVVVGCLGHPSQRRPGETPVYALDVRSLEMRRLATRGDAPGWVHGHVAELSADARSVTVRGGKVVVTVGDARDIREQVDDWSLDVESLAWTRLTDRRWIEWEIARADGGANKLMYMEWMSWSVDDRSPFGREQLATSKREIGWMPDLALYAARYSPPVDCTAAPEADDHPKNVRVVVEGVTVRYVEEHRHVRVVFEGPLPQAVMDVIVEDVRSKLAALERCPYTARRL